MTEKHIQGVKIKDTGHKKIEFDYDPGDMKALYNRGEWGNWQEEIDWLKQYGEQDNELTPGETVAMVEDLQSLKESGAPFTTNPERTYELAHKHRAQNMKRYAEQHAQAMSRGQKR